jgi:hypothetical protein
MVGGGDGRIFAIGSVDPNTSMGDERTLVTRDFTIKDLANVSEYFIIDTTCLWAFMEKRWGDTIIMRFLKYGSMGIGCAIDSVFHFKPKLYQGCGKMLRTH